MTGRRLAGKENRPPAQPDHEPPGDGFAELLRHPRFDVGHIDARAAPLGNGGIVVRGHGTSGISGSRDLTTRTCVLSRPDISPGTVPGRRHLDDPEGLQGKGMRPCETTH